MGTPNSETAMSQCAMILDYMIENGEITQAEAYEEIGCSRLASRIHDLKRMGHNIRKEMREKKNRWGKTVRFARYYLEEESY